MDGGVETKTSRSSNPFTQMHTKIAQVKVSNAFKFQLFIFSSIFHILFNY